MKKEIQNKFKVNTMLDELLIKRGIIIKESSKELYDRFHIGGETIIVELEDVIHVINNIDSMRREQMFIMSDGTCTVSIALFGDF